MTAPYFHACSSARVFGGKPEDYLALHDWFDATKALFADYRHRALRHQSAGIFELERLVGKTIVNSNGRKVPTRYVGEQHVIEDCSRIPTVGDWLSRIRLKEWMTGCSGAPGQEDSPYGHCCRSAARFGGEPEDYLALHTWFDATKEYHPDCRHRALRHHSYGIFELERLFGTTARNSAGLKVAVRSVGEQHVLHDCGCIPTLQDWLSEMRVAGWMARATVTQHLSRRLPTPLAASAAGA